MFKGPGPGAPEAQNSAQEEHALECACELLLTAGYTWLGISLKGSSWVGCAGCATWTMAAMAAAQDGYCTSRADCTGDGVQQVEGPS